ncbi:MAG: hypothetical protein ACXAB8_20245 [Promethearchaeota archaeon]|jgi:epoxyqueuosine reductase
MNSNDMMQKFHKKLSLQGYVGKIVNAKRIPDLKNDIKKRHEQNLIFPQLYEDYKAYFEFEPKVDFAKINSLFIIAVPAPQYEVRFTMNRNKLSLIIPPTYLYGLDIITQLKDFMSDLLNPEGYNFAYAQLPQKTLAVRSGLAEYGRNNITYVSGLGSFHRLATFYTDFPVDQDNWQELRMMDLCKECTACPTDRFLLHAGRCLTYHNEQSGDVPFPEWIDPAWHNCLVGCLHCQRVCPANKKVKYWIEPGPEFSEEETESLLKGKKLEDLSQDLKKKITKFDLENYLELFPRNLGVFFQ